MFARIYFTHLLVILKFIGYTIIKFKCPSSHICFGCFNEIKRIKDKEVNEVLEALSTQDKVTFVQIGSNDGKTGDPIYNFASSLDNWKGVLVEPLDFLYERLKLNYAHRSGLSFENVVISNKSEKSSFYYVSSQAVAEIKELPSWYDQVGGFSEKHITNHLGEKIKPFIRRKFIKSITLHDLFNKNNISELTLLHIDTEGHDFEILKQLDFKKIIPKLIIVEHKHLNYTDSFRLIRKLKNLYHLFYTGSDLIAILKNSGQDSMRILD